MVRIPWRGLLTEKGLLPRAAPNRQKAGSHSAAAKSGVELNPVDDFQYWNFNSFG
jgi:hypothetical protein